MGKTTAKLVDDGGDAHTFALIVERRRRRCVSVEWCSSASCGRDNKQQKKHNAAIDDHDDS